jgi:hypothetical protein
MTLRLCTIPSASLPGGLAATRLPGRLRLGPRLVGEQEQAGQDERRSMSEGFSSFGVSWPVRRNGDYLVAPVP